MAWIESHQQLRDHPKTADLCAATGWDLDQAIGKLHRLWWWAMDYAEDGDLRRHSPARIAVAMGLAANRGDWALDALKKTGWIDRRPYLRLHEWWSYAGPFLRSKYKRTPDKWERLRNLYVTVAGTVTKHEMAGTATFEPNLTLPNQPNQPSDPDRKVELNQKIHELQRRKGMNGAGDLEDARMPFGEKKGVRILDLDPTYCAWLLERWGGSSNLDPKTRAALRSRVDIKNGEMIARDKC